MIRKLFKKFRRRGKGEIYPDEIFIDSSNLPQFDIHQFEGRFERPISRQTIIFVSVLFLVFGLVLASRLWILQVKKGQAYAERSEMNRLSQVDIFANRGVIFDRNGVELASNATYAEDTDFARRQYATVRGVAHLVGYVKYPTKDSSGFYFRNSYVGEDGIEKVYHDILSGKNGVQIIETDALGRVQSESTIRPPVDGKNVTLTIDSRLNNKLYEIMERVSGEIGFTGGAGVIMDVKSGEVIASVSFPEYNSALLSEGDKKAILEYQSDRRTPFLNRVVSGLYTPGSIIKPAIAMGALTEGIISPDKKILSTGSITVENPYFPDQPSIYRDWKAHGWVDMRRALAVSSNIYFFAVGGGLDDQKGLGIYNIEKYIRMFGLGKATGINLPQEKDGIVPDPEWKKKVFGDDDWRLGDTYNTVIGQYGVQFTPIQLARYYTAIANDGILLTPKIVIDGEPTEAETLPLKKEHFQIVKEGMRESVLDGTAAGLNAPYIEIAAKTGTAELGVTKELVNVSSVGFFPYQNPKYAFAILMERGPRGLQVGASYVMRQLLDWMHENTPEYFQ